MRGKDAIRLSEMKTVTGVNDTCVYFETATYSFLESIPCMLSCINGLLYLFRIFERRLSFGGLLEMIVSGHKDPRHLGKTKTRKKLIRKCSGCND